MSHMDLQDGLPRPELMPERYEVEALLGRGGMAAVYRVRDRANGLKLALKQLSLQTSSTHRGTIIGLFEREFQTLAQLHHPHVISVYDYGLLADGNPYYTMELLDGGDLRDRAPLPWREACRLLFDVGSSLALLHSRRLLHRDISPRNIRCTQDGRAKLIDFGAMAPFTTGGADIVGTPAFIAPETLHRLALDSRTDLFSLGVTLYFALTGRVPYPAKTFPEVLAAWSGKVIAPSAFASDTPAALDDLVLQLIHVEPVLRPGSAFEVMQRLAAIAGLEANESHAVSRAYLATPTLVGRARILDEFRKKLVASSAGRGAALCLEGSAGIGRSRLLDACALEAKPLGFTVLRAAAHDTRQPFATVYDLTRHLLDALSPRELGELPPELFEAVSAAPNAPTEPPPPPLLRNLVDPRIDAERLQEAICRFWISASRKHPLLVAVDDIHRVDAASAAVLAVLIDRSRRAGIVVAFTADSDEPSTEASAALMRRCRRLRVEPLTLEETRHLLGSLFGETANLHMIAEELHAIAQGNPRHCMELAQHLVDHAVVRYEAGTWILPSRLSSADLPRNAAAAKRDRIARLTRAARLLAQCQALAFYESLRGADHHALLPGESSAAVEAALAELLSTGILVSDGSTYSLPNRLWVAALLESLSTSELTERHNALAAMYRGTSRIAFIYHAFLGDMNEAGLEALLQLNAEYASKIDHEKVVEQNIAKMMGCYPRAHQTAEQLGKSLRVRNDLRRWHLVGTSAQERVSYPDSAHAFFSQLAHDSGLDLYRADTESTDHSNRLMRALTTAHQRYATTAEVARVYSVEEAIRLLAEYVVFCIVIAVRSQDYALLQQLPPILEPFSALSPVLEAIWQNALATCESGIELAFESARSRWLAVLSKLDAMNDSDVKYAKEIATAIAFGIGCLEAQLGIASAAKWSERLDRDAYQRLAALQLRRIERLEQGDWKGADRLRRQAEVLALRSRAPQMFGTMVSIELNACASACDLSGVRDALERIRPLAACYPGWRPNLLYAEGCFHAVRGDYEAAKAKYEECIASAAYDLQGASINPAMWFAGHWGLAEAWLALGEPSRARDVICQAEKAASRLGLTKNTIELTRVCALAEAKLNESTAVPRLEAAIAEQHRLGVTGLQLGLSYEARARIALWQGDAVAFEQYAALTAREYRYGAESTLGVRYTRLINEASRHGLQTRASLADFADSITTTFESARSQGDDPTTFVARIMAGSRLAKERAAVALDLICGARNASGYLYTVSATGLVLSASRGDSNQPPDAEVLLEFVTRWQTRENAIDDMATDEFIEEAPRPITVVEGTIYELLVLSCSIDGIATVVGIAAITGADREQGLRQTQLLQALAPHLLEKPENTTLKRAPDRGREP